MIKKILQIFTKLQTVDSILVVSFFTILVFFILIFARSNQFVKIRVKVTDSNALYLSTQAPNEFAYSFMEGDIERNQVGQKVGEILQVDRYRTSSGSQKVYLDLNLKANYNPLQHRYSAKGRPIVFGQSIIFTFDNVKFEGLVVDFPGFQQQKIPVTLLLKTQLRADSREYSDVYGLPKYFKDIVKVGDVVKDSEGNKVIEIEAVKTAQAIRTVISNDNRSISLLDSDLIDIFYDVKVQAYENNGKYFIYDYIPLELTNAIPIVFDEVSIYPIILDIQVLNEK